MEIRAVSFDAIELYAEVRASPHRIKQQYPIGLIANGTTYSDRCGLPNTFDAQVFSPEHGFEKPDQRALTRLVKLLAIDVRHLLHVGDGPDDVEGANGIGATSVFINRIGARAHPAWASTANHQISNLEQLEALLGVTGSSESAESYCEQRYYSALSCASASTAWQTQHMISVHIMYPKTDDSTFDMDYYCSTHMPMLANALGDACKGWGASSVGAGAWEAIGWAHVESQEALDVALKEHGAAIMGDVPNYTNVQPAMVIGQIAR